MKISKLDTLRLRNPEHFMFHTEFKDLVLEHSAEALKIQSQFDTYLTLYDKLDEGFKKIIKSAITAEIQAADKARDIIWSDMLKANSAALRHFDPDVQKAAKRLKVLFDTYGNIAITPLDAQTALVINILQELHGNYAADVAAVGLVRWVAELQARNKAFQALMKERYDETTSKTDVVVKQARAALDESYRTIADRIAAFVTLEGAAGFEPFIRSLNSVIERFNNLLATRAGKKKTADKPVAGDTAAVD
jgi:hypothetical protein